MIERIWIAGAGFMGAGIAQVAVQSGFSVCLYDAVPAALGKARVDIDNRLKRLVEKSELAAGEHAAAMERLTFGDCIASAKGADLIIEAIREDLAAKTALFQEVEHHTAATTYFASNTSSISITEMATAVKCPERFVGMHFFSPVPRMKLLEIVYGLRTSRETMAMAEAVGKQLGKTSIVSKDTPGFLVNRVLNVMLNEAVHLLCDGSGTIESIDAGMRLGCNHPMGPLELIDFAGVDIFDAVINVFYAEFKDSKYRPTVLVKRMIRSGMLGKKSGAGFYLYDAAGNKIGPNPELVAYMQR